MKKYISGASTIQKVSTGAILLVAAVIMIAFGMAAMGFVKEGEPSPFGDNGISASSSGGCSLKNEAFTDIGTVSSSDYVYNKIGDKYPALNNDRNKSNIVKIISSSINEKINPAVLISFYFGEQTFNQKNDFKAFGCGKFSGSDKGIDNQIKCALPLIGYAIEKKTGSSGVDYGKPAGANTWDRLLYNYVSAARAASFRKYGYTTDSKESRIQLLQDLVPEQVECETKAGKSKFSSLAQVKAYFGSTPEEIQKHLVTTTFMGKSIKVNEMMKDDLAKTETKIKGSGYKITTIGAYNFRQNVNDPGNTSAHAFGLAIDINPDTNPNAERPSSSAERDPSACKHDIPDSVAKAFEDNNFFWGAKFKNICDPMHFQYGGNWD